MNLHNAGWHLDHVEVVDDATGKRSFFPCQKWFDKTEDDGQIERVLEVLSGASQSSCSSLNCCAVCVALVIHPVLTFLSASSLVAAGHCPGR